jgi:hypothetical protein
VQWGGRISAYLEHPVTSYKSDTRSLVPGATHLNPTPTPTFDTPSSFPIRLREWEKDEGWHKKEIELGVGDTSYLLQAPALCL